VRRQAVGFEDAVHKSQDLRKRTTTRAM
jgi:hypothetical protein